VEGRRKDSSEGDVPDSIEKKNPHLALFLRGQRFAKKEEGVQAVFAIIYGEFRARGRKRRLSSFPQRKRPNLGGSAAMRRRREEKKDDQTLKEKTTSSQPLPGRGHS